MSEWLIKLHDTAGEFYLLSPRGPWSSWGSKSEAQRFETRDAALKRLREMGPRSRRNVTIEALVLCLAMIFCAPTLAQQTPRMSYQESSAIKRSMLPPGGQMRDYELDHIVSLALGGTNDRANLCLQPWPEAEEKDRLERALIHRVRSGTMALAQAQTMLHNWTRAYREIFGEPAYAAERGIAERAASGGHPSLQCN